MDDYLNCIVDVPLPDLEDQTASEFDELRKSVKPVRSVGEINVEWSRGEGESIFQGIPDENDLSRKFGCSPYRARQILNFETLCFRLMRIRLEAVSYEIARKTEGYLAANEEILSILEERIRRNINGALNLNVPFEQALNKYSDHFMDHVTVLEGTHEGKLIRLYTAIRQIQDKIGQFELFGTSQFHDVLERRLLTKLQTMEQSNPGGALIDSDPPEVDATGFSDRTGRSGVFPEPPRDRRAEDSPIWKKFEKDQTEGQEPSGSISWQASFSALGPFFTVRILLRRGLYEEIMRWLVEDEGKYSPELPRILMDCMKAEQNIRNRGWP